MQGHAQWELFYKYKDHKTATQSNDVMHYVFSPFVPLPPDVLFLLPPALHELFCFLAYFCSSESKKLSICAPVDCCLAWMGVLRLSSLPPESDGEREGVCKRRV